MCWFKRVRCPLLMIVAIASVAHADKKSHLDPQAVLRHSVEASDIWSAGPVRLKVRVKFMQVKAGEIEAEYEKVWISPKQWRVQFLSADFNEVSVGGEGEVWESLDPPEKPLRVREFERALAALSQTAVGEGLKYAVREVPMKDKKKNLTCVLVDDKQRSLVQDCIDPDTGLLLQARDLPADLVFTYSDYRPFSGKQFPSTIGVIEGNTPVAIAQVVQWDEAHSEDVRPFEPTTLAVRYKACPGALGFPLGASGGKLVKQVNPVARFAPQARPIIHYSAAVFAVIGRDGTLHSAALASGSNRLAGDEILQAVRQWRYEPFTVCGNPVEIPTAITVNLN